jgi:nitrogen regulatory protein PII
MSELFYIITITDRSYRENFIEFYRERGIHLALSAQGRGTATENILDYLGLENTDKAILFAMANEDTTARVMRGILSKMRIDAPGRGIAFTIPVSSVGGGLTLKYLTENELTKNIKNEAMVMKNSSHELVIAIAESGSTDLVMDAARSAGAFGGTVIHAKGTGADYANRFFGVSIAEEKEMIFLVVKQEIKSEVMKAIMTKSGLHTEAHAIVFSLPVSSVEGLHSVSEEDAEL